MNQRFDAVAACCPMAAFAASPADKGDGPAALSVGSRLDGPAVLRAAPIRMSRAARCPEHRVHPGAAPRGIDGRAEANHPFHFSRTGPAMGRYGVKRVEGATYAEVSNGGATDQQLPNPAEFVTVREMTPEDTVELDRCRVSCCENTHFRPESDAGTPGHLTLSFRFDLEDRSIVFTGDTGPCTAVEQLARGVDLLVGEMAARAGAASVVAVRVHAEILHNAGRGVPVP